MNVDGYETAEFTYETADFVYVFSALDVLLGCNRAERTGRLGAECEGGEYIGIVQQAVCAA